MICLVFCLFFCLLKLLLNTLGFVCFSFCLLNLLLVPEMIEHNLLNEYPVLEEKKELVAQFKFTVLITPNKTEKLNSAPLPYVSSEKKVFRSLLS
jgi:methionine aminopeptidase